MRSRISMVNLLSREIGGRVRATRLDPDFADAYPKRSPAGHAIASAALFQ
jgi:hypothetical protein